MTGGKRWILLLALVAVIAINLVQFRSIEATHGGVGYAALGRLPSSDIVSLARANERIDGTYGMYLDLREASPRSHLVASTDGALIPTEFRDVALSFGDAASATLADFDDTVAPPTDEILTQGADLAAEGTLTALGRTGVPWQLITGACGVASGPTPGRHLVVVQWGSGDSLTIGLVESCLLPDGFAGPGA